VDSCPPARTRATEGTASRHLGQQPPDHAPSSCARYVAHLPIHSSRIGICPSEPELLTSLVEESFGKAHALCTLVYGRKCGGWQMDDMVDSISSRQACPVACTCCLSSVVAVSTAAMWSISHCLMRCQRCPFGQPFWVPCASTPTGVGSPGRHVALLC
jgi:hypothetical protein